MKYIAFQCNRHLVLISTAYLRYIPPTWGCPTPMGRASHARGTTIPPRGESRPTRLGRIDAQPLLY